jgi:hypothetical protein
MQLFYNLDTFRTQNLHHKITEVTKKSLDFTDACTYIVDFFKTRNFVFYTFSTSLCRLEQYENSSIGCRAGVKNSAYFFSVFTKSKETF